MQSFKSALDILFYLSLGIIAVTDFQRGDYSHVLLAIALGIYKILHDMKAAELAVSNR